jgi:hypothetical protein
VSQAEMIRIPVKNLQMLTNGFNAVRTIDVILENTVINTVNDILLLKTSTQKSKLSKSRAKGIAIDKKDIY